MFCVGITGGIASGKSTVAQMFVERGIPVIDADVIARRVVEPGKKAWQKLKYEFGVEILNGDGTLNREKLSDVIFDDAARRRRLNEITHPEIMKAMAYDALKYGFKGYPFVVLDIPLLYETGDMVELMHKVIVVNCREDAQIGRLMLRNNISFEEARKRIRCQMPLDQKCERADLVIDNSGTIDETTEQVDKIIDYLRNLKFHYRIRFTLFIVALLFVLVIVYFVVIGIYMHRQF